jgi:hypothetical protein
MKLVTISLKLAIDFENAKTIENMIKYLNEKLQTDPQFFGNLKPDNIIDIEDICVHS